MVDMGVLVGTVRRLGIAGPPYEVMAVGASSPDGEPQMLIHLIESGEDVEHAVSAILNDPLDA